MKRWIGALILLVISAALIAGLGLSMDDTPLPPEIDDTTAQTPVENDTAESLPVTTVLTDTTGTLKTELIEVTPTSVTYTMANISNGYVYDYGSTFSVQQKIDGEWYRVPELPLPEGVHRGWTTEAYILFAGKMSERTERWGGLYGSLPKGQYRLIKGLDVYYSESVFNSPLPLYTLVDERYTIAIEFTIE
ncbi:MAG: hypothetical protein IKY46_04970 [Clostridia bacterium]|nr:hypothetical protein [Clostridia bacterium]MBR5903761.1 hypothetical protein [Clostridia bacterium]